MSPLYLEIHKLKIIGGEVAAKRAKKVFEQLFKLSLRGNEITEQNVDYALSLSFEDNEQAIVELDDDHDMQNCGRKAC